MATPHHYELDLELCPKDYKKAHFDRSGEASWQEEYTSYTRSYDEDGIDLELQAYGESPDVFDMTKADAAFKDYRPSSWRSFYWLDDLWEARPNSWLIPTNTKGGSAIYANKATAAEAILQLADRIHEQTGKMPIIEAVRLENDHRLRLYQFAFLCEKGGQPYINAEICGL